MLELLILFLSFIIRCNFFQSFAECKDIMLHRGKIFYKKLVAARGKVAKHAVRFISDGSVSSLIFYLNFLVAQEKNYLQLFIIIYSN